METPNPPFVMTAPSVREKNQVAETKDGYSFGIWGGANAIQHGEWYVNGNEIHDRSNPWMSGGMKFRRTWPFDNEPLISDFDGDTKGLFVTGALEGEAFWVGSRLRPKINGSKRELDMDSAVFMLNFLVEGKTGDWHPYIGPGFGAAAIFAHNYDMPGRSDSSDDDLAFAVQGLVGADYYIDKDWSLFGEYRYLAFLDADFFNGATEFETDSLNQHIFSMGVRYHF